MIESGIQLTVVVAVASFSDWVWVFAHDRLAPRIPGFTVNLAVPIVVGGDISNVPPVSMERVGSPGVNSKTQPAGG